MAKLGGYVGKILRVDLTKERITEEKLDESTLRMFIGGSGLGTKIMYDEVPAGVEWSDPENRLIWATGVFSGTKAPGSGTHAVVTKGPLTNLLAASHANGYFGARLKFAKYDAIVVQGSAKRWVYLYIHDGVAELRDAAHLVGRDTWETEDMLKKEIAERQLSVSCIGPAGENLVKYAAILCDKGHIAASNGCGTVMGSKKLKAIAVHGKAAVPINDKGRFTTLVKDWWEQANVTMFAKLVNSMGTPGYYSAAHKIGWLPVKNLTTSIFPDHSNFGGDNIRKYYNGKPHPCYGCRLNHCYEFQIKTGPHKGEIVEEAEYEDIAAFSSQIGNGDVDAAEWLNNVNDRLGMDAKEQAFLISLAMECYEKGLITKKDTDGIELTWGNVQAVETMLHKIARRNGFGDVLAEGVMRAAQKIGGDAPKFAVYTHKGNAPHVHDPRAGWSGMFLQAISDNGSMPAFDLGDVGDLSPALTNSFMNPSTAFSAESIPHSTALLARRGNFVDSLGVCYFVSAATLKTLADAVSAATGWDFTWREAADAGERIANLMRAFNIRHGHSREHDTISPRLVEAPQEGLAKGISIGPVFDKMVDTYYESLNWDKGGRPLPETLKRLGLDGVAKELWG
ncbi:aldehyde ferredoxin oxidoreductase family protein [Chloroflexota bacterium]